MVAPTQTTHRFMIDHGNIYVLDSIPATDNPDDPIIVLLHGNSFCLKIWKHIFESDLAQTHRIVAIESKPEPTPARILWKFYPGHGDSSDANNPEYSYNQPAYADAALQVISILSTSKNLIVVGWSLGGHVAIEMAMRTTRIKGIMITGTPPIDKPEEIEQGFTLGPDGWRNAAPARAKLTDEEIDGFAHGCADSPYADWMLDCVKRTDGQARELMFKHFGDGEPQPEGLVFPADTNLSVNRGQKSFVEQSDLPVAVVNGKGDPFINLKFIRDIKYKNLWAGECIEMEGAFHAPFWGQPKEYQEILDRFVKDVS